MYEAFYGLREKPFNLTPDPRFLYLSDKHKEAFAHLLYGIKNRSGFVMVSGEIGTGKTTICRTLLNQLDANTDVAFIFNPYLSPVELLKAIVAEFGVRSAADTAVGLIGDLNRYLLKAAAEDKNCVLVIDEAQNLAPQVLEQIRLLSNLETETQKLIQIVLIGQPELAQMLALNELRQLNQRITARYHLEMLSFDETLQYIAYRIRVAGGRKKVRFTRSAVKKIYRISGGTPRVINALCDRALLIGYTRETRDITPAIVRQAAKEIRGSRIADPRRKGRFGRLAFRTAMAAGVVGAVIGGAYVAQNYEWPAAPAEIAGAAPAPKAESPGRALIAPAAEAAVRDPEPTSAAEAALEEAAQAEPAPVNPLFAMLSTLDAATARQHAAQAILRAWNRASLGLAPAGDEAENLAAFGEANGLLAERLSTGLDSVIALGYPAFVRIGTAEDGRWLALLEASDTEAVLSTGTDETVTVSREQLAEAALDGEAVVLWQDGSPGAPALKRSSAGQAVRSLQAQLHATGFLEGEPSGRFDSATEQAVRALQEAAGLAADGIAGRQTRMILGSWLPTSSAPSLRPRPTPSPDIVALLSAEKPAGPAADAAEAPPAPEPTPIAVGAEADAVNAIQAESSDLAPPAIPEAPDTADASAADGEAPAEVPAPVAPETAPEESETAPAELETPSVAPATTPEPAAEAANAETDAVSKAYPDEITAPALGSAPLVPLSSDGEETR